MVSKVMFYPGRAELFKILLSISLTIKQRGDEVKNKNLFSAGLKLSRKRV